MKVRTRIPPTLENHFDSRAAGLIAAFARVGFTSALLFFGTACLPFTSPRLATVLLRKRGADCSAMPRLLCGAMLAVALLLPTTGCSGQSGAARATPDNRHRLDHRQLPPSTAAPQPEHDDSTDRLQWLMWYTFTGRSFVSRGSRALDDAHTSLFLERNLSQLSPGRPSVYSLTEDRALWNETAMKENKRRRKTQPGGAGLGELSALPSDWLAQIDSVASTVLSRGGVRGLMLGDELLCRGVPPTNLSSVTEELRKRLPRSIWLWTNECESVHELGGSRGGRSKAVPWWSPDLDVVSIDLYEFPTGKMLGVEEADHVRGYYEHYIFPLLSPHQNVAVVPGLFADSLEQHHHNRSEQDEALCSKLASYQLWIQTEPRIVGMAPFHWDTFSDANDSTPAVFRRGGEGFPKLLKQVAQLRHSIKNQERMTTALIGVVGFQ